MKRKRTARQTENLEAYRRLRRNLLARMRYRKKQGFKVNFSTVPKSLTRVTKKDIERLQKSDLKINRHGEVVVTTKNGKSVKTITREDLHKVRQEPKYNESDIHDINEDYISLISRKLEDVRRKGEMALYQDINIGHGMQEWKYEAISQAYIGIYEACLKAIDESVERVGEDRANNYYRNRFNEISIGIADFLGQVLSDEGYISEEGQSLVDMLIVS